MKKLESNGLKVLKIVHLFCAFLWIGGALSMLLLLLTTSPEKNYGMYMRSLSLQLIDDWLIIPGAIGCMLTGVVYGVWSKWGFFKHNWITVKWILTILMALFGTFAMGPWVNDNVYPIDELFRYTTDNNVFAHNVFLTMICGIIQTICLLLVVVISVFKPWKKKK
jgi:hypothetical protein